MPLINKIHNPSIKMAFNEHAYEGSFIAEARGGHVDAPSGEWYKYILASKMEVEAFFGSLSPSSKALEAINLRTYADFKMGTYIYIDKSREEEVLFFELEVDANAYIDTQLVPRYQAWSYENNRRNDAEPLAIQCSTCGEGFDGTSVGIDAAVEHECEEPREDFSEAHFVFKPRSEVF